MTRIIESVIGLDPGPKKTGWVHYDGTIVACGHEDNNRVLMRIRDDLPPVPLIIEEATAWGHMHKDVLKTVHWEGRFAQACRGGYFELVTRQAAKRHILGRTTGDNGQVRAALEERFGLLKEFKSPHIAAALAVAVTATDRWGEA